MLTPQQLDTLQQSYAKYSDSALPPRVMSLLKLRRKLSADKLEAQKHSQRYAILSKLIADVGQELTLVLQEIERRLPPSGDVAPF